MTSEPRAERVKQLDEDIREQRKKLAEMEGTDDEPRFADDGRVEEGMGTDVNAPPG